MGANSERKRNDADRRESRLQPKRPQCVSNVLYQVLDPARAARIATLFFYLLGTANRQSRPSSRLARLDSLRNQLGLMPLQMKSQLCFELPFHPVSAPQPLPPVHSAPPSEIPRMSPMAWVSRSQLAASVSSCARPFRVSR